MKVFKRCLVISLSLVLLVISAFGCGEDKGTEQTKDPESIAETET